MAKHLHNVGRRGIWYGLVAGFIVLSTLTLIQQLHTRQELSDTRIVLADVSGSQQTAAKQAQALEAQVRGLGKVPVVSRTAIPTPVPTPVPVPGPQGDPGIQGPIGPQGIPGVDGRQGPAGPRGAMGLAGRTPPCVLLPGACQGAAGPAGAIGKAGADGTPGVDGKNGADGVKGDAGAQGIPGADGKAGKDGVDGKAGADGQPGAQGKQGDPGPTCPDGTTLQTTMVLTSSGALSAALCVTN
jgi:hypothetical protein